MREIQFREALNEAMCEEMRIDPSIILLGEEVAEYNGAYKVSKGMLDEFGENRVIDTPISECGFSGIAIGASMNGLKPIVEFMTFNFSLVAIDQIINNAAKMYNMSGGQINIPIVFRGATGSAGQLGATHSQDFSNWYANCPGLKVIQPSNPYDAKGLLKSAIKDSDPVVFMESEQMYGDTGKVPKEEYTIPIGLAEVVKPGNDVTLVGFGKMMKLVSQAALELEKDGINCEVIDLRTLRPIDYDTIIRSVIKTNRMVFIEESWPLGSFAAEITFKVQKEAFDYLDAPIKRVTGADVPMSFSPPLIEAYLPSVKKIVDAAKAVCYK